MKFIVTRASLWRHEKPCEKAYQKEVLWPKKSKPTVEWIIDIPDLKTLLDFTRKNGQVIISDTPVKGIDGEIEIYDDYRE